MLFERAADGSFALPESYPEDALVAFGTHDVATFSGWMTEHDLAIKEALGINPGETRDERRRTFEALRLALGHQEADFHAVAEHLSYAPSRLLVVAMEDVLNVNEQVNLPGTIDEHPNWRGRLPISLEDFWQHVGLKRLAAMLETRGRSCKESQSLPSGASEYTDERR